MIPKVKGCFQGVLNGGIYVYTFIKIIIVLCGKKNRKDALLKGV